MEYRSAAKPSLYAYPAPLEEKKSEEREKVATAVLSIAARQKRRENADNKKEDEKMDVDEDSKEGTAAVSFCSALQNNVHLWLVCLPNPIIHTYVMVPPWHWALRALALACVRLLPY